VSQALSRAPAPLALPLGDACHRKTETCSTSNTGRATLARPVPIPQSFANARSVLHLSLLPFVLLAGVFVGLLVCWFVGLLVRWFVGSLIRWFVDLLVR
jgi:hypothetical protein